MGKKIIVMGDDVKGDDKHPIIGVIPTPPGTAPGVGDYKYTGKMTLAPCPFAKIDGQPIALITSKSTSPAHIVGFAAAKSVTPSNITAVQSFATPPTGLGIPTPGVAGSKLVTFGGVAALLDGDKMDTCSVPPTPGNGDVKSAGQSFVSCDI